MDHILENNSRELDTGLCDCRILTCSHCTFTEISTVNIEFLDMFWKKTKDHLDILKHNCHTIKINNHKDHSRRMA